MFLTSTNRVRRYMDTKLPVLQQITVIESGGVCKLIICCVVTRDTAVLTNLWPPLTYIDFLNLCVCARNRA